MSALKRLTKTASTRISRNPYNALGAILVMFLTFFVGGIFILVTLASNTIIHYYETKPTISGFLKDDTTATQVNEIKTKLQQIPTVSQIKYISKEEALNIYKDRYKDEPTLVEFVTSDILPASVEVSGNNIHDFEKIANTLREEPQISGVNYFKNIIDKLIQITSTVRFVGIGLIIFLLITSITVILVVIGLNISLHKDEIEIMKLVGATKAYVRLPFIIEGVSYGIISAILAVIALAITLPVMAPWIEQTFNPVKLTPTNPLVFVYIMLTEMFVGIVIGFVGAWIATRRYLEI